MLHSYTHLLGKILITARVALIGDEKHEFIYLGDTLIKKYQVSKYSLKAIKRWCRLYLRKNLQNPLPAAQGHPDRVGKVGKADAPLRSGDYL